MPLAGAGGAGVGGMMIRFRLLPGVAIAKALKPERRLLGAGIGDMTMGLQQLPDVAVAAGAWNCTRGGCAADSARSKAARMAAALGCCSVVGWADWCRAGCRCLGFHWGRLGCWWCPIQGCLNGSKAAALGCRSVVCWAGLDPDADWSKGPTLVSQCPWSTTSSTLRWMYCADVSILGFGSGIYIGHTEKVVIAGYTRSGTVWRVVLSVLIKVGRGVGQLVMFFS